MTKKLTARDSTVLIKRAEFEFSDSQTRLKESNNLIKLSLAFSGSLIVFALKTELYEALLIQGLISAIMGLIWLEDQFKMHRKMWTKKCLLKKMLGKNYDVYEPENKLRSYMGAKSYLLSGFLTFVVLGIPLAFFYPRLVNISNSFHWGFVLMILILIALFSLYFILMSIQLWKNKSKVEV